MNSPTKPPAKTTNKSTLPVAASQTRLPAKNHPHRQKLTHGIPPAALVYGGASGAFFTFSFLLFSNRHWVDGIITLLPAGAFLGFAVHIVRHGQPKG